MAHAPTRAASLALLIAVAPACSFELPAAIPADALSLPDATGVDADPPLPDGATPDAEPDGGALDTGPRDTGAFPDAEPDETGPADAEDADAGFEDAASDGGLVCLRATATRNRSFDANQEPLREVVFGQDRAFALSGPFAVELWLKHRDINEDRTVVLERMQRDASGAALNGWELVMLPDPAQIELRAVRTGTVVLQLGPAPLGAANTWNHIAFSGTRTTTGATVRLFVGGQEAGLASGAPAYPVPNAIDLRLPPHTGPGTRIRFRIDDLHFSDRVLVPFDPRDRTPAALVPSSVALWPFDEVNGNPSVAELTCTHPAVVPAGDFNDDHP